MKRLLEFYKNHKMKIVYGAGAIICIKAMKSFLSEGYSKKMTFTHFNELLMKKKIKSLHISTLQEGSSILVKYKSPDSNKIMTSHEVLNVPSASNFLNNLSMIQKENDLPPIDVYYVRQTDGFLLIYFFALCGAALAVFMTKQIKNMVKNQGESFNPMSKKGNWSKVKNPQVTFKDIAGLENVKVEVQEIVEFMRDPKRFQKIGARLPRGILLSGSPGTGKTLLAKACATEAGVSFFSAAGSQFVEKYAGLGASNIRQLFNAARASSPAVIFIDELDAVGKKRETRMMSNTERETTLNQLLVEMDGFATASNVIVMGATNRPENLDPALLRPGRFDRQIHLSLPALPDRRQILELYLKKIAISEPLEEISKRLATVTPGFSGADLSNLVNEAAISAARAKKSAAGFPEFNDSLERIIGGVKRGLMSEQERRLIAYHQAGKAVVAWVLPGADPIVRLSIVPRAKESLGFTQFLSISTDFYTKSELFDQLTYAMAGRATEEAFFDRLSNSSSEDLQKAFQIARAMLTKFGMAGALKYGALVQQSNYNDYEPLSELSEESIDTDLMKLIDEGRTKALEIVKQNKNKIEKLAELLISRESVSIKEISEICGERSGGVPKELKEYFEFSNLGKI